MSHPLPFDVVARILFERLQGCEPSDELRATMRSVDSHWERIVGIASAHFVLPAMAAGLRDFHILEALDGELAAFFTAVHAANVERNVELCGELAAAVKVLNRAGIEPVLLKGAIRLLDDLYPDAGWRMLRDLDLLIAEEVLPTAVRALEEAGYAPDEDGALWRDTGLCKIELHDELFAGSRQVRLLSAVDVLNESRPLAFRGAHVRIPSVEHQLVHLVGHGQLRHCGHAIGRVSLRDRLEAAALLQREQAAVDWQAVTTRFRAAGYRRPLLSFVLALRDAGWAAVPVTDDRIDLLTALQRRRIALQIRSRAFDYVGSRAGWWASEVKSQINEHHAGQPRGIRNLKRVMFEPGAARRMARAFWTRQRLVLGAWPYLSLLIT